MDNKNIVLLQAAASILMGSDYFMPKAARDRLNEPLRRYFSGVKIRSSSEVRTLWIFCERNKWKTIYPTIYLIIYAACLIGFGRQSIEDNVPRLLIALSSFISLPCTLLFVIYTCNKLVLCLIVAMPIAFIATFLEKSDKGPMAAVGFMILMVSLYVRYQK